MSSPFLTRYPVNSVLLIIAAISMIGIAILGVGFALASFALSGGQITPEQRPERSVVIPWPIYSPPAIVTVSAALIAVGVTVAIAARAGLRQTGTLVTFFGWALGGAIGSIALALAFPQAQVWARPLIDGISDHWIACAGFGVAASVVLVNQGRLNRAEKRVRATGLHPAFLYPVPPQGSVDTLDFVVEAPPLWEWRPTPTELLVVPPASEPGPVQIAIFPDVGLAPSGGTTAIVDGLEVHRRVTIDSPERTVVQYRYPNPRGTTGRVMEVRILDVPNRHERAAYCDSADIIAGFFRWR